MKRLTWSLASGMVILISGTAALLVSSGVVRAVRAQAPALELPPPPAGTTPADPNVGEAVVSTPAAPGKSLDSSQDPGLRMENPEGFVYDPSGRRDPFFPPKSMMPTEASPHYQPPLGQGPVTQPDVANQDPLLAYFLRDFKLIGILWDVHAPRAMIRAPNNRVYTVQLRMKIGRENAVVAAIREKEVLFVEPDDKGNYKNGEVRSLRIRN